jgi:hypothetical protein
VHGCARTDRGAARMISNVAMPSERIRVDDTTAG